MEQKTTNISEKPPGNRLIWGGIVFIIGFLCPLLIPFVIASDLSTALKSLISGLLALGIPELFMLISVAILGKPGFNYLKSGIFKWLKKYGPPDTVSRARYRIGLVFFLLPMISALLLPYLLDIFSLIKDNLLTINIVGDIMLFISLFILGGDFWDKLRSLFTYKSKAVLFNEQLPKSNQDEN